MRKVLIIGARAGSLGHHIHQSIIDSRVPEWDVATAGITGAEQYMVDLRIRDSIFEMLQAVVPTDIICTVGMNDERYSLQSMNDWLAEHYATNVIGPMALWQAFREYGKGPRSHFVAISSNSAHIARRNSMAYCASKAALSMAIRVAAREEGSGAGRCVTYGYELGLLAGTPMTVATEERFGPSQTRMPGNPLGLAPDVVADQIVAQMATGGWALNGSLLRLDAGEQ